ncbi:Sec-independent protein translocase protein TatA [Gordonia effusa NBRC 100432]|uniref:Sec-independent protein translocase protein TatA n=1 Tax=Gordonia effusa NBRC 100432 TaxID=1077974 RepID=H0R641_9ACTN|nr:Sec-independent protein translocase subunit TatA [Gordonia effusa]GAB20542.1 Sec-independent protein translocase protein TatA [Gordonia effusa NBRC 100432]
MGAIQPWHIILVVLAFVILFGSKKLPDAARGLGRSLRIFKSEVKEMANDGKPDAPVTEAPRELSASEVAAPAPVPTSKPEDVQKSA